MNNQLTVFTQCYEKDFLHVLNEDRLHYINKNINHLMFIIINTFDYHEDIQQHCEKLKNKKLILDYVNIYNVYQSILDMFDLTKEDFTCDLHYKICMYNMAAFYFCKTPYMGFFTGDSTPVVFNNFFDVCIQDDITTQEQRVYTLCWRPEIDVIKNVSFNEDEHFYFDKTAFSDQCYFLNIRKFSNNFKFLLKEYTENLFPHLDAFESRFFKYMTNNNVIRRIYKNGLYLHKNY